MISYSVTLQIDQSTRTLLQQKGYTLYLFKGVNAGSGATSTVWLTVSGDQLYDQSSNTISWYEDYYIGEESTEIQNGAAISGTNPYATPNSILSVGLGQNYIFPGTAWNPQSENQPIDTAFTIQNNEQAVNNFHVSQKVTNGPEDYIVVTELLGSGGLGTFTPIETVAMILSTQPYSTGTMITEAFSPGAIITLAGIQSGTLAYDGQNGWSATAGQLTLLNFGDAVYDSMLGAAGTAVATTGRYPGAPLGASLPDGKNTKSKGKVNGVQLNGISGAQYSKTTKVTVICDDKYAYQIMSDQTDVPIKLGTGVYQLRNNSGGSIEYAWL
jgi:hypothetical protein